MQIKTLGVVAIRLLAIYSLIASFKFLPQSMNMAFVYDLSFLAFLKSLFVVFILPLIIPFVLWIFAPQIASCLTPAPNENIVINSVSARQIFKLGTALFGLTMIPWAVASLVSSFVSLSSLQSGAAFSDFNSGTKGLIFVNLFQFVLGFYLLFYSEHFTSKLEKLGVDFNK